MQTPDCFRRWAGLGTALVLVLACGCVTSPDPRTEISWRMQAEHVAAQRLEVGRTVAQSACASEPVCAARGDTESAERDNAFLLSAWAQDAAPPVTSAFVRLAADTGESAEPTTMPSRREMTQLVERGPLAGFIDTVKRDAKRAPGELWADAKRVYTDPGNLLILGVAGGASIALRPEVDDDIEDYYHKHHTFKEDWRDAFGAAGNPAVHFAVAGVMYLAGQQLPDTKTYEVGRTLFSALIINSVSTSLLKLATCTEAPNGENWAWPSGHTSSTMTLAAVMHEAYGIWAGLPLYGLTTFVAWERLDSGEHHFSDVVFGAAMGWVIGHTVAAGRRPEIFGGELIPYADPNSGNAGVAWIKSLD